MPKANNAPTDVVCYSDFACDGPPTDVKLSNELELVATCWVGIGWDAGEARWSPCKTSTRHGLCGAILAECVSGKCGRVNHS